MELCRLIQHCRATMSRELMTNSMVVLKDAYGCDLSSYALMSRDDLLAIAHSVGLNILQQKRIATDDVILALAERYRAILTRYDVEDINAILAIHRLQPERTKETAMKTAIEAGF